MRVGFIGAGRIGSALAKGLIESKVLKVSDILMSDIDKEKLNGLEDLGVEVASSNASLAGESDVIFLTVKPKDIPAVLDEIGDNAKEKLVVSVAAGVTLKSIESKLGNTRVIRAMPNIPCLVGEAAVGYSLGSKATKEDSELVKKLFSSVGLAFELKEELLDAVTGLSGSGPAYFYLAIKALTDAAVAEGIPADPALRLAAQTAKGAGEMILGTGCSPQELIDDVCSPGGTTIEGLNVLKKYKVEEAFREALKAATKKSKELSK